MGKQLEVLLLRCTIALRKCFHITPSLQNDPSQLRPDLGPAGQDMWEADGGLSDLLGFVTSFPMTKDACKTIGEFWLPFFALDDYVEHHSLEEAEDVAEWYKALWRMR